MFSAQFDDYEDEDFLCHDCFMPPPPSFNLPPPPCPPDFVDAQWTCPSAYGEWSDSTPASDRVPIAAMIVASIIFLAIGMVAAFIIYRVRSYRRHQSKNPPIPGVTVYDDEAPSPIYPLEVRQQGMIWRQLQEQVYNIREYNNYSSPLQRMPVVHPMKVQRTLQRYTPQQTEPLYQCISYTSRSGSDPSPSNPSGSSSTNSHKRYPPSTDSDEDDSALVPLTSENTWEGNVNQPNLSPSERNAHHSHLSPTERNIHQSRCSPSEVKYYMSVPLHVIGTLPSDGSIGSSHVYESLPMSGIFGGTYRENNTKPLPPLPSRSDRFRNFLPHDRGRMSTPLALLDTDSQPCHTIKPSSYL